MHKSTVLVINCASELRSKRWTQGARRGGREGGTCPPPLEFEIGDVATFFNYKHIRWPMLHLYFHQLERKEWVILCMLQWHQRFFLLRHQMCFISIKLTKKNVFKAWFCAILMMFLYIRAHTAVWKESVLQFSLVLSALPLHPFQMWSKVSN